MTDCVLLREIADIIAAHPAITCAVQVDEHHHDGRFTFTVSINCNGRSMQEDLDVLEIFNALRYLAGVGQIRAFASEYGIPAADLEAVLDRHVNAKE
jgi:hypothetical protein